MAISFPRPDPSSPSSVASASFTTTRKGFEPSEVREFLRMVAAELARLQERERFLERELRNAQRTAAPSSIALDDELVTKMLGEEAARILHTSREAASQIKSRAEDGAARLLREATDEVQRLREEAEIEAARRRADATADAEAELEMAKQQGREMVNEARAYRERVLNELSRRREIARQQIEQLVHGRDRLLQAFERARLVSIDVMAELTPLGEPNEYVNLSPTTGPVPLMVKGMPRPGSEPAAAAPAPAAAPVESSGAREAVDADATVALAVSPVVPLVETERDQGSPAVVYVDDEVEAERDAERAIAAAEADADAEPARAVDQTVGLVLIEADDVEADVVESYVDTGDDVEAGAGIEIELDDTVVVLDISPRAGGYPDQDDDREPAPVVALFAGEIDHTRHVDPIDERTDDQHDLEVEVEVEVVVVATADGVAPADDVAPVEVAADPDATVALTRTSADDLFARLRAARAESVAQRAAEATKAIPRPAVDEPAAEPAPRATSVSSRPAVRVEHVDLGETAAPAVFQRTDEAPAPTTDTADTPFGRRDEALTPLIVAAGRKLKRVLADEQNEVLHALRRKEPVRDVQAMVADATGQADRYAASVADELLAAALAGASSMGADLSAARRTITRDDTTAAARQLLVTDVVTPLRDRLARCVADADGDNAELASMVRLVYREWKSQRIDEHLDDIARTAFGHGALAGVAPGTPVRWAVDPQGPECSDAEDNTLGGVVGAGAPFPTDHPCAPAHPGCRCMIVRVDRP